MKSHTASYTAHVEITVLNEIGQSHVINSRETSRKVTCVDIYITVGKERFSIARVHATNLLTIRHAQNEK